MPSPPRARPSDWSAWKKSPKILLVDSGERPSPSSRTESAQLSSLAPVESRSAMRPLLSEYLLALSSRLFSTCSRRSGSPVTSTGVSGIKTESSCPRGAIQRSRAKAAVCCTSAPSSTVFFCSTIFPRVTRETSSRSLTRWPRLWSWRLSTSRARCSRAGSAGLRSSSCSAIVAAASGLRNSCAIIATNSSLRRSASSSRSLRSRDSCSARRSRKIDLTIAKSSSASKGCAR